MMNWTAESISSFMSPSLMWQEGTGNSNCHRLHQKN